MLLAFATDRTKLLFKSATHASSLPADVRWGSFDTHSSKCMRDKRTPTDVCGEASMLDATSYSSLAGNWSKIARAIGNRTDNQCWRRWIVLRKDDVS